MLNSSGLVVRSAARRAARSSTAPLLLAVSGGLDSVALLAAMAEVGRASIAGVATFDHGTGSWATLAAARVRRSAEALGIPIVVGRADGSGRTTNGREAAWRDERWRFLRHAAATLGASVATAHTEDDQVETVLMRALRGSGARGLSGLYAESGIVRPFVSVRRSDIAAYALERGLEWTDDPSNGSRDFLRNRVRHELLPAVRRTDPGFEAALLELSRRAARLRRDIEHFVSKNLRPRVSANGRLVVAANRLQGYDRESLAVLWSALAGRAGLALDHRGTRRIAEFTSRGPIEGRVPMAGGWYVEATGDSYVLERSHELPLAAVPLREGQPLSWGRFRFVPAQRSLGPSPWSAVIQAPAEALVRPWTAGDRLAPSGGQPRRRVTRYLSEAGLRGTERDGWPVVMAGEEIVWIPGVRRSDAATDRSGRPVRHYVCERIDR